MAGADVKDPIGPKIFEEPWLELTPSAEREINRNRYIKGDLEAIIGSHTLKVSARLQRIEMPTLGTVYGTTYHFSEQGTVGNVFFTFGTAINNNRLSSVRGIGPAPLDPRTSSRIMIGVNEKYFSVGMLAAVKSSSSLITEDGEEVNMGRTAIANVFSSTKFSLPEIGSFSVGLTGVNVLGLFNISETRVAAYNVGEQIQYVKAPSYAYLSIEWSPRRN